MHTFWNILIALILVAGILGGVALFWIARQDESRAGSLLGLLAVALAVLAAAYLTLGHHWF